MRKTTSLLDQRDLIERRNLACTVSQTLSTYVELRILQIAPPEAKTLKKYEAEEKKDMELVRRWRVVIEDIEITNQSPKLINPFIRFTLGGNYYVSNTHLPS